MNTLIHKFSFALLSFSLLIIPCLANSWDIFLDKDPYVMSVLEKKQEKVIYTGNSILNIKKHKAPKDKEYIFVPLKVSKASTNKDLFDSYKLHLVLNKNKYTRIEGDEFLDDFSFKSFPHLRIRLGFHKGIVVYEVPKNSPIKNAFLEYEGKKININIGRKK